MHALAESRPPVARTRCAAFAVAFAEPERPPVQAPVSVAPKPVYPIRLFLRSGQFDPVLPRSVVRLSLRDLCLHPPHATPQTASSAQPQESFGQCPAPIGFPVGQNILLQEFGARVRG